MKHMLLPLSAVAVFLASCAPLDEYHYGYAPAYRDLPAGFQQAEIRGTTYWHHGGRFYKHDTGRGYLLVKPPRGHAEVVAVEGAASPAPNATAIQSKKRSWIMPGGGSIRDRKPKRNRGRSPIRQ